MLRALRVVTVERGVDPRDYALLPFGGAGPLHAAAIAAELGIDRILCPRAGGVLSAFGLVASERRRDTARTVLLSGADLTRDRIAAECESLATGLARGTEATLEARYELRYRGQSFELGAATASAPTTGRSSWSTSGWRRGRRSPGSSRRGSPTRRRRTAPAGPGSATAGSRRR